jgi:hypothetical protein
MEGKAVNQYDVELARLLKIRFGTAPQEPSERQLNEIKRAIEAIRNSGRLPTWADWQVLVYRYCPGAGQHRYAGMDNSDLDTLLALARRGE